MTASVAILAVLTVADGSAAEGNRKSRTAQSVGVWARVTWTAGWMMPLPRLIIVRGGERLVAVSIRDPERPRGCCPEPRDLRVEDFDDDGEPEVLVTLSHGGVHDRAFSVFFTYDPSHGRYRLIRHEWAEPRPTLRDLNGDGATEFVARDTRFSYVFTSFGGSRWPIQVWTYRAGLLTDTTRGYRSLIREDAEALWREYRGGPTDALGVLAAYQAEKYLLGEEQDGWRRLRRALARGRLGPRQESCLLGRYEWPSGQCYLRKLRRFLRESGYAR